MRFGHPFAQTAIDNSDNKVSPRILSKLGVEPPSPTLVNRYLREIARTYNVDWGTDTDSVASDGEGGGGIAVAALEPPLEAELSTGDSTRREPIAMAPPSPTSENPHPTIKLPPNTLPPRKPSVSKPPASSNISDGVPKAPSIDDLMSRFEALKKR